MFTRTVAVALAASPLAVAAVSPLLVHEGHSGATQASGTVNAVDPAQHKVNLSHGSIKVLGWPATGCIPSRLC
jgi:Cu/Ag efflux protein CusF